VQARVPVGPGKRVGRRELNTLGGGMIFLQDDESKQQFNVDTGAVCSVLPHRSKMPSTGPQLSGADGRAIPCWGSVRRRLSFGLRTFFVTFLLAAIYRPILGLDFLSAHGLLVDPVGRQVLDSKSLKPLSKPSTAAGTLRSKCAAALCSIASSVRSLLASFPAIVGDGKGKPSPKHKIRHTIETTGRPVFAKARRLDQDKLRQAEAEFRELEAAGIIRRSDSTWSSPLHMVRKKDGSWRPCGDYRRLNLATTHDRYPLLSILDLSNKLHGCKFFSCIHLVKGYHQISMAAQDVAKTAIITSFGLFEYLFMPFGLRNAAQTFQHFMDSLFKHLPFVFCYLDDIIIASHTLEEHHKHLRQIFTILQENSLQINPAKCVFAAAAVEFLGHRVDQHGVRPLQRHVQAISDFPPPQDVKQLQQYLGMVNFYRCFLPGIARTLQPLTDALKGAPQDAGVAAAVRHFRFLLEGRQFRLLTDHMPLVTSLFRNTPPWSARQQRQLSFIAEFTDTHQARKTW
jgi:hypothetical protein